MVGNGFNLHAAMELDDDRTLYCTVHVSLKSDIFTLLSNHTFHPEPGGQSWTRLHDTLAWPTQGNDW